MHHPLTSSWHFPVAVPANSQLYFRMNNPSDNYIDTHRPSAACQFAVGVPVLFDSMIVPAECVKNAGAAWMDVRVVLDVRLRRAPHRRLRANRRYLSCSALPSGSVRSIPSVWPVLAKCACSDDWLAVPNFS